MSVAQGKSESVPQVPADSRFKLGSLNSIAVIELAADGHILCTNPLAETWFGLQGHSPGTSQARRLHSDLMEDAGKRSASYSDLWKTLQQGMPVANRWSYLDAQGQAFECNAIYVPVAEEGSECSYVMLAGTHDWSYIIQFISASSVRSNLLSTVELSDRAVLIVNEDGRVEYCNPYATKMYGYTFQDGDVHDLASLMFGGDAQQASQWMQDAVGQGGQLTQYRFTQGQNGLRYWTQLMSLPVRGSERPRLIVFANDVTGGRLRRMVQKPVLEALIRDQPVRDAIGLICTEIETLVPGIRLALCHLDESGILHPMTPDMVASSESFVWEEMAETPDQRSFLDSLERGQAVFAPHLNDTPFVSLFNTLVRADESVNTLACWATPIKSSDEDVLGVLVCLGDWRQAPDPFLVRIVNECAQVCVLALERHQARLKLEQLAYYDAMTGLPNRRHMQVSATKLITKLGWGQESMAVVFMDVDRLKHVNDSLGYVAGDTMLRAVARRLSAFSDEALVGRLSGDEFVLAMPLPSVDEALPLVEKLRAALSESLEIAGMKLEVSVSMGISMYPSDGQDIETLLHRADVALHQAKAEGAGSFGFFSTDMNQASHGRLVMEAALRNALRTSQFELFYQPQVNVVDGQLYGVEALLRWQHPEWGMIGPDRFIPLAEEQGLMAQLGVWVLEQACCQLRAWRARGLVVPAVSINVSASNLRVADFPQQVAATLAAYGLTPHDLRIEVTEGVMLDSNPGTMAVVREIENLGVRLSLDDFGTGYSSWGYLSRLPLDEIKLDKSFVQALDKDEISRILCQAVVRLGEAMNLTVVAEGVETQEHFSFLRQQKFGVVQGYWIARPMHPLVFEQWLEERDFRAFRTGDAG